MVPMVACFAYSLVRVLAREKYATLYGSDSTKTLFSFSIERSDV
jgi:hypothetical protein